MRCGRRVGARSELERCMSIEVDQGAETWVEDRRSRVGASLHQPPQLSAQSATRNQMDPGE
jgi:hypothetical protein